MFQIPSCESAAADQGAAWNKALSAGPNGSFKDTDMAMVVEERPLFENEEWVVTESGLEHRQTGYFIERDELAQRRSDGLWTWPIHMAEKSWCTVTPFMEAFSCAASLYGVKTDAVLAESFKIARCEIAAWPRASQMAEESGENDVFAGVVSTSHILQNKGQNTISVKPGWSEIHVSVRARTAPVYKENWRPRTSTRSYAFSQGGNLRSNRLNGVPRWRAPYGIRKAGTRIVQLFQAAWNIK